MRHRSGAVSLPELLLALWLSAFVLLGLSTFVSRHGRVAAGQRDLVRFQEARRTAEVILGGELRALGGADVGLDGPSAVRLRAVRASGPICRGELHELELDYAGVRLPDPTKDSLLLLDGRSEQTRALRSVVGAAACGESGLRIALDDPPGFTPRFALLFESGAYHAAGGALRYAIGAGGRQPLTEAVFREGRFAGLPHGAGYLLVLTVHPDSLPAAPRAARAAARLLNASLEESP